MRIHIGLGLCCAAAFVALTVLPAYASTIDAPPELKQTVKCMLKVLKAMPNVEGAVWHPSDGLRPPFLEYHFQGNTIAFHLDGVRGHYQFITILSGLFATARGPNDFGTGDVIRKWRAECGANAIIFFP